jgi:hypothetical protein
VTLALERLVRAEVGTALHPLGTSSCPPSSPVSWRSGAFEKRLEDGLPDDVTKVGEALRRRTTRRHLEVHDRLIERRRDEHGLRVRLRARLRVRAGARGRTGRVGGRRDRVDGRSNNEREGINVPHISLKLVAHVLGDELRRGPVLEPDGRYTLAAGAFRRALHGRLSGSSHARKVVRRQRPLGARKLENALDLWPDSCRFGSVTILTSIGHDLEVTMSAPFIVRSVSTIHPGKADAYEPVVAEFCKIVEEREPRLLGFHIYVSEDRTSEVVVQIHPDAESMQHHLDVMGEKVRETFAFTDFQSLEIYGEPNSELKAWIERVSQGVEFTLHAVHWGGFTRLSPDSRPRTPPS